MASGQAPPPMQPHVNVTSRRQCGAVLPVPCWLNVTTCVLAKRNHVCVSAKRNDVCVLAKRNHVCVSAKRNHVCVSAKGNDVCVSAKCNHVCVCRLNITTCVLLTEKTAGSVVPT
ncbi:hypothetical protein ABVT39_024410 [Epinephelus coioides]